MKIYYDTEFLEDGNTIRLISIGMVREDGKTYYAVIEDEELITDAIAHPWLRANVVNSLPVTIRATGEWVWNKNHPDHKNLKTRSEVAYEVKKFLGDIDPELWAYYSAYDHVALCQLWGRMIDLPNGIPMYTNDIKQEIVRLGSPRIPEQKSGNHNALEDAKWNKEVMEYLRSQPWYQNLN